MSKRIRVTAAVIRHNSTVLAARRGDGRALAGLWEFPGGKIEPGETPRECLQRELKEELLIDAAVGDEITTTVHEYDFGTIELTSFWCDLPSGSPTLTEHEEVRWVDANELTQLEWAPADVETVEAVRTVLAG